MTQILERPIEAVSTVEVPVVSCIKQAIDARLAEIHTEPKGRHELIVSALMLGSAATRQQIQV